MASSMVLLLLCITSIQLATAKECPDQVSTCADMNTCCLMKDQLSYGCCPLPNAVCCSDHIHCCPSGLTCNVEHAKCDNEHKDGGSIMWILALLGRTETPLVALQHGKTVKQTHLEHTSDLWPKLPVKAALQATLVKNTTHTAMVPCPDSSVCPEDYTCCPFSSGDYGCCPYSQGVCCPDHVSCCPNTTTCTSDGTCQPN